MRLSQIKEGEKEKYMDVERKKYLDPQGGCE
jgi:hypothetical protein